MLKRIYILLLVTLTQQVLANSLERELKDWFLENESLFNEAADYFESTVSAYPSLNHIDLEAYSPKQLAVSKGALEGVRKSLKELKISSAMRGDFSGEELNDTVYFLKEKKTVGGGDFGLQIGFVRTEGDIKPLVTSFGNNYGDEFIEFILISKNWYLYQRRFSYELISFGSFVID